MRTRRIDNTYLRNVRSKRNKTAKNFQNKKFYLWCLTNKLGFFSTNSIFNLHPF